MTTLAETSRATECTTGEGVLLTRRIDEPTARLDVLARSWISVQTVRKGLAQRDLDEEIVDAFRDPEEMLARELKKTLRVHALWPWLVENRCPRGAHVALVIGRIGDPRRFPGQPCTEGHILPAGVFPVGSRCPVTEIVDERGEPVGDGAQPSGASDAGIEIDQRDACPGVVLKPRPGSGCRALGQHAGLAPGQRKRKGHACRYDPRLKASLLMPDAGIAAQIIRHNTPVYADTYRDAKARLMLRVPEVPYGIENSPGDAALSRGHADRIARVIAAKTFLGDLLVAWKGLTSA